MGQFTLAQGMNKDYICNQEYDEEVFTRILLLKDTEHWESIDYFMGKEYLTKWLRYKEEYKRRIAEVQANGKTQNDGKIKSTEKDR